MKYYKYLYISNSIKHPDRIKRKLKLHMGVVGYYLICLSNKPDQVEIIASYYLKLPYYRKYPPIIIGITKTYEEALEIIIDITNDSISKISSANIVEYLKQKVKTNDFINDIC